MPDERGNQHPVLQPEHKPRMRLVALYLNEIIWKYVELNLNMLHLNQGAFILPDKVHNKLLERTPRKIMLSDYGHDVTFRKITIPLRPGLNDVRYYAVHDFLSVMDFEAILAHPPHDPEHVWYSQGSKPKGGTSDEPVGKT